MRKTFLALVLVFGPSVYASDSALKVDLSNPEIRQIIREEADKMEKADHLAPPRYVVVHSATENSVTTPRFFGFTEEDVLLHSGDSKVMFGGNACSPAHEQGDLANRWCHAFFAELTEEYLKSRGVGKGLSAMIAASVFVPKEYLIDKHPSSSDLVTSEYEFYESHKAGNRTSISVTAFGDGALFFTLKKQID